ncbi:uncharacterized protein BCR38DRAFT_414736 [Pseudomassariella vexata]|uniref:Uncharacterized protein n=1 Tax=Pseudomassariella vexata TaxID=1141098 RepID=A0A1Y2D9C9_9PEZI|nr:uncharacterized protein BCR38DRAFT_414736 [Pseudomassariella vexata]ORY55880.1 hypothetical protein BCR38DRAFT_414736 [Pseudomassariella vexata]
MKNSSAVRMYESIEVPEEIKGQGILEYIKDFAMAGGMPTRQASTGLRCTGQMDILLMISSRIHAKSGLMNGVGSIEKRARFPIEVTKAVVEVIGSERRAIWPRPFSDSQEMLYRRGDVLQFGCVFKPPKQFSLAASLHLIEARISGNIDTIKARHLVRPI